VSSEGGPGDCVDIVLPLLLDYRVPERLRVPVIIGLARAAGMLFQARRKPIMEASGGPC